MATLSVQMRNFGLLVDAHAAVVCRRWGALTFPVVLRAGSAEKHSKWSGLIAMDRANKATFGLLMFKNIGELSRKYKSL